MNEHQPEPMIGTVGYPYTPWRPSDEAMRKWWLKTLKENQRPPESGLEPTVELAAGT